MELLQISALLSILTLISTTALAQINKCVIDGKMVFTDQSCPGDTGRAFELGQPSMVIQSRSNGLKSNLRASSDAEQQAAEALYIDDLRLLDQQMHYLSLNREGVRVAYVERDTRLGNGKYFCGGTTRSAAENAAQILDEAITMLPTMSVQRFSLRYLLVCSETASGDTRIGGIPVPPLNLLMLSIGKSEAPNKAVLHKTYFHEFFHFIEYRDNSVDDLSWQNRFGSGYLNSYDGNVWSSKLGGAKSGFLNSYSTTFGREERAEIFAYLMGAKDELLSHLTSSQDSVLKDKVRAVSEKSERLLGTIFYLQY